MLASEDKTYEVDPIFEQEFERVKASAKEYGAKNNDFRASITRSVLDTYRGRRSVSSFVRFAAAMMKDEDGYFKQYELNTLTMFVNTLKSMDIQLEIIRERNSTDPQDMEEIRARTEILTGMINGLVESQALTTNDCKVHFSSQLLKDCNIIPNKVLFDRRLIRLNTAMLYKQHKFNLLREDSEGYASLINELTISSIDNQRDTKGKLTPTSLSKVPEFLKTISSHIGVFHLDPNRVLDIILDFYIKQLTVNYTFWTEVIKQSAWIQKLTFIDVNELCESYEHLTTRFMPLMRLAGYRTYLATDLIQTLILIIGGLLDRERDYPGCRLHLTNMIREFLLPAISFSKGNPGTMASVWEVLCRLSFQERYCLYGEWSNEFYKKNIETKLLKARVERAAKSMMRRVSKNDVRRCGRDLGKLAHSNPTIVFNVVLDQVQSFDNLAPIMADACRYLGDFAYDVLGFILTDKWTGSQGAGRTKKEKEKDDGMPASWLRSLAVFTGMLFKKQDIDSTPFLRYMAYRLRYDDSVADLILLNEFITKMGGIEILASACTNDQITAAGCSDSLKSEAFLPISPDNRRASRRVLGRLKDSLRRNNVGLEILVLLYRLEEACMHEQAVPASDRCSKLDKVHQTQLQYLDLLTTLFEPDEYATLVPSVETLVNEYALPVHIAMTVNRAKTQHAIRQNMDTPVVEGEVWAPFKQVVDVLPSLLQIPAIPSIFTSEFYFMFWQLSLYDIYCPINHYEAAIKRHTDMIRQCQDVRSSFYQNNRPSVVSKAERQAQASLDMLNEDLPRHQSHVEKVMTILKDSQKRWFPSSMQRQALISNILQHCILPRSKISCMAIEQALKSGEAHLIKNAFLVLRQFAPCFPGVVDHGNSILKIVKRLSEEEKRPNIKVLARSYIGLVTKYKSSWTTKNAFLGLKEPSPPAQPSTSADTKTTKTDSRTSTQTENEKDEKRREATESSTRVSSASRPSSPSRRTENGKASDETANSSSERKRSRESEHTPRDSEKISRIDESGGRHRTASGSARDSPRDVKDDRSSRTPRVSAPSATDETSSSRHYDDRNSNRANESNSRHPDERPSSRLNESLSSSRYNDDRTSSGRINTPSSLNDPRSSSARGSKRVLEDRERDRGERPDKRSTLRDMRDDRGRDDRRDDRLRDTRRADDRRPDERRLDDRRPDDRRPDDRRADDRRIDDRRMDDRRMDDRRMDDRRFDERRLHDRRERERDHRSSRRR
ncbi:hypothetical protein RMATCC62417_10731 [Rhizopus microsporus]|nr:hypothetical protein RMATCC62417_10731 [Rhizopus microsporus]